MKITTAFATGVALVLVVLAPTIVSAQSDVGTIVMVEGHAEVGRAGSWHVVTPGEDVQVGDTVKTGLPGRVRIAFQDSSTITVGDESTLVIDESVFDPDAGAVSSYLRLLKGKVRALVSEYYKDPAASYSIGTTTAVSGVRGTDFIVVYDDAAALTEVIGITGRVEVHGAVDLKKNAVFITAGLFTRVAHGKLPTAAQPIGADEMRRHLDSLYLVGAGAGPSADDPILVGGDVPHRDRPSGAPGATPPGPTAPPAAGDDGGVDRSSPSDVAGEPIGAVENLGNIEIPFVRGGRP